MVDFDNEVTVGTPAVDVVRILILQRRADVFEAWEKYKKDGYMNVQQDLSIVRARLNSFFLELQSLFKRTLTEKKYGEILTNLESEEEEVISDLIHQFNNKLDEIKLTRLDTKGRYDKTRVEKEHKAKGL